MSRHELSFLLQAFGVLLCADSRQQPLINCIQFLIASGLNTMQGHGLQDKGL